MLGTVLVALFLAAAVALILRGMRRNKKQGRASCGCGCAACTMHDACHGQQP